MMKKKLINFGLGLFLTMPFLVMASGTQSQYIMRCIEVPWPVNSTICCVIDEAGNATDCVRLG